MEKTEYQNNDINFSYDDMRFLQTREDVFFFMNQGKKNYCFGAGEYGQRFVRYCQRHNLKVAGFVVSDGQRIHEQGALGLPVFHLADLRDESENINLIVAVNYSIQEEVAWWIEDILPQKNVKYLTNMPKFLLEETNAEWDRRAELDIFDYKQIARDFECYTIEHGSNMYYGHAKLFKKLLGLPLDTAFPDSIEHAPIYCWTSKLNVTEIDPENCYGRKIYCASLAHADFINKCMPNKEAVSVGLFMQYVTGLLDFDEVRKIKEKKGKILVIFPAHNVKTERVEFDIDQLIAEIKKKAECFDTVIVCLYYYDILLGFDKLYINAGFEVVSTGVNFDHNFLARLRSIIELADVVMANAIGTFLPYSVCLGKPVYIFRQDCHDQISNLVYKMERTSYTRIDVELDIRVRELMYNIFGTWKKQLSKEQKDIIKKYIGDWNEKPQTKIIYYG